MSTSPLPVTIFTALRWERDAVLGGLGATDVAGVRLADGSPAHLVSMGVGMRRALAAAQAAPESRCFVVIGCSGALRPAIRTGDVVVASAVGVADPDGRPQAHWPAADAGVAKVAQQLGVPVHVAPVITSPTVLEDPARKAALAESGAIAVDMETAAVMGVAVQRRLPCVVIRVILDEVGDALPPSMDAVDEDGEIRLGNAMRTAFAHPRVTLRLFQQQRAVERRLRQVVPVMLRVDALGLPPA